MPDDTKNTGPTGGSALTRAVCAVMEEVKAVGKSGNNTFHKYRYSSDEDILGAVQPAMARHGLALIPKDLTHTFSPAMNDREGDRCTVVIVYELRHEGGETVQVTGIGTGCDKADKGPYKAMTGALKYVLTGLFLIPRSDDPERFFVEDEPGETPREPVERGNRATDPEPTRRWSDGERKAFCAAISDLGFRYEDVADWCESLGKARPSRMTTEQANRVLNSLEQPKWRNQLTEWVADRNARAAK